MTKKILKELFKVHLKRLLLLIFNRIDDVVIFNSLVKKDILKIIDIELENYLKELILLVTKN